MPTKTYKFATFDEFKGKLGLFGKNTVSSLSIKHQSIGAGDNETNTLQIGIGRHIIISFDVDSYLYSNRDDDDSYLFFLEEFKDCKLTPLFRFLIKYFNNSATLKYIFFDSNDEDDYCDYVDFEKVFKNFQLPNKLNLFLTFRCDSSEFSSKKLSILKNTDLYLTKSDEYDTPQTLDKNIEKKYKKKFNNKIVTFPSDFVLTESF